MTVHNTVLTNFIAAREYTNEYQETATTMVHTTVYPCFYSKPQQP